MPKKSTRPQVAEKVYIVWNKYGGIEKASRSKQDAQRYKGRNDVIRAYSLIKIKPRKRRRNGPLGNDRPNGPNGRAG